MLAHFIEEADQGDNIKILQSPSIMFSSVNIRFIDVPKLQILDIGYRNVFWFSRYNVS